VPWVLDDLLQVRAIAHYCLRKLGQKGRPASLHRAITLQEIVRYKVPSLSCVVSCRVV
jgi:hypothetical protein